ncbi:glycoside hydrolase family 43 protein [Acidipila sp. EB88]|uniref:glycoside hydrolase family 43 protein n=1 Tax=Acidipila sp. EB88 TaxID=2305226 RepID=UPI000F5E4393|nr:glycoside hydrolase family 43 protein [Acidipila sp. EB88]RRA49052.1 glycoside hydrolase [Acidipila sp. EB88]
MTKWFLFAVILFMSIDAKAQEYSLTFPVMPLHDPFILADQASKTYFLYTSNVPALTGEKRRGTMAYESKDLQHWSKPVVVFTPPDTFWAHDGAWAPEVHAYHGRWYLFTTLHNEANPIPQAAPVGHATYMRGTIIAVAQSPAGPFLPLKQDGPVPPADFMTLDGTLYIDHTQKPWMVYAHEWLQKGDGTMEAVPLTPDLSGASGPPIHLFKGSDAPWLNAEIVPSARSSVYITDGPELFRTKDNHLLMLWSSYEHAHDVTDAGSSYVETVARSRSGEIQGPWEQLEPLVRGDSGHGMLFHTFDGRLMLVLHHPFRNARGKIFEVSDRGDHLAIVRERIDLDGGAK